MVGAWEALPTPTGHETLVEWFGQYSPRVIGRWVLLNGSMLDHEGSRAYRRTVKFEHHHRRLEHDTTGVFGTMTTAASPYAGSSAPIAARPGITRS